MSSMLLKGIRRGSGPWRRPGFAERLPDDAAPAGAERALDVGLAVGRRRRGEPERVRRLDAQEIGAKIANFVLLYSLLSVLGGKGASVANGMGAVTISTTLPPALSREERERGQITRAGPR